MTPDPSPVAAQLADLARGANRILAVGPLAAEAAALASGEGSFTVSDPEALGEGRFDLVILGDVLENVVHPGEVLDEIRSRGLIEPGGSLAAVVTNAGSRSAVASLLDAAERAASTGLVATDRLRFFTRQSLVELCERHGFVVTDVARVAGPPGPEDSLTPAVRRYLAETPDSSATHLVVRAEPAAEPYELARLRHAIERFEADRVALEQEIGTERRTFIAQRSEAAHAHQALRSETALIHERFISQGRVLEGILRSPSWRVARLIGRTVRAIRHPVATLGRRGSEGDSAQAPSTRPAETPVREPGPAAPTVAAPAGRDALSLGRESTITGVPRLSIVIPVYNGKDVTRQCLESIDEAALGVSFEVVVVDNASTDGVSRWLAARKKRHPDMQLISNKANRGFGPGTNQGAQAARGEYMLICNSDVIIPPGALERLVGVLDSHPEIGIVSPVTNYVGEGPQLDLDAREVTPETALSHASRAAARDVSLEFVPDRLVFFCVLIRKGLFDLLGGFPEAYGIGNFEDDDLCVRARMAGYLLAIDPGAFVFHHGSVTWKAGRISHDEWMSRNRPIYFDRLARLSTTLIPRPQAPVVRPDVSVIVRTVDRPLLLRQALVSLANQTFRTFEVVLVSDAGGDLDDVLTEFAPYLTIRLIRHPEARGRTAALNSGLEAARGRWITYLDDDDVLYPSHLDVLVHALRETGFRVAYADVNKVLCTAGPHGDIVLVRESFGSFEFDPDELLVGNRFPIQSIMHAAACVPAIGLFDTALDVLEDWDFVIRLSRRFPFYHVRRPTSEYRFRVSSETKNTIVSRREDALQSQLIIYERYPTSDGRVQEGRLDRLDGVRLQIETIRSIRSSSLSDEEKALSIAGLVAGFSLGNR